MTEYCPTEIIIDRPGYWWMVHEYQSIFKPFLVLLFGHLPKITFEKGMALAIDADSAAQLSSSRRPEVDRESHLQPISRARTASLSRYIVSYKPPVVRARAQIATRDAASKGHIPT